MDKDKEVPLGKTVQRTDNNGIKKTSMWRIFLPVLIGLVAVAYLFFKEFNPEALAEVTFTWKTVFWIFMAILCMIGRDLGYMIRIRVLSENQLSWKQSFRVIMLWEFTSAITPSSVGGTSVALMYVHKEGLSVGKSSTIVMLTSLLDEFYFMLMFPLLLLVAGTTELFSIPNAPMWADGLKMFVFIGYALKTIWVLLLSYGLFINPRGLSKLIFRIFHLPGLRRWKRGAAKAASDIIVSSKELKTKKMSFWIKSFFSTFLSWTSRYWVVNCLFLAFFAVHDHFLIFARQLVMWVALLVSPTPGGSGIAEIMFDKYLGEFIPIAGLSIALALLWRIISYYPYLAIGAMLVPKWINDNFVKKDEGQ